MKLLALDTATEACSAAILIDGDIAATCFELAARKHGDLILAMITQVLDETALEPNQLDCLAFGRGPGSFTGVRIASSVAQGIAYACNLPVAPVSTLSAIAFGLMREQLIEQVAVALDARMGEIYSGFYQYDSVLGLKPLLAEKVCAPEHIATSVISEQYSWHGAGSAWAVYGDILCQALKPIDIWPQRYPDARDIALLGAKLWQQNLTVSAQQAIPVYLRDAVAQPASG